MQRSEIEAHPGHNIVIAKLYDTHDRLREITEKLDEMASELAARREGTKAVDRGFLQMAVAINNALQQVMHAHHGTEDEVIFPYLTANFGFDASKLDEEHGELMAAMPALQAALVPLLEPGGPPAGAIAAFAAEAKRLRERLAAHLANEEATAVVALLKLTSSDIQRMFGGRL